MKPPERISFELTNWPMDKIEVLFWCRIPKISLSSNENLNQK